MITIEHSSAQQQSVGSCPADQRLRLSTAAFQHSVSGSSPRLAVLRELTTALTHAEQLGCTDIHLDLSGIDDPALIEQVIAWSWGAVTATCLNGRYRRPRCRTKHLTSVSVDDPSHISLDRIEVLLEVERQAMLAKRLIDTPRAKLGPDAFARLVVSLAHASGLDCEVVPADSFVAPATYAVGRASCQHPNIVKLTYRGAQEADAPLVVLCGKGVTFDTGGLGLKGQGGMRHMKADMTGAATVVAAVLAAAKIGLRVNVVALAATAENVIGPAAMAPGDLIRYRNGLVTEVTDTDAEGRLLLADLCTLAIEAGASHIVTVGTLMETVSWTIGRDRAGLYTSDGPLLEHLLRAQQPSGEKIWHLPIPQEHDDLLSGGWVDLVNSAGPEFGALQPALFLKRFARATPWAHLEIAGPAWNPAWSGTGGTGFGVGLLCEFLRCLS